LQLSRQSKSRTSLRYSSILETAGCLCVKSYPVPPSNVASICHNNDELLITPSLPNTETKMVCYYFVNLNLNITRLPGKPAPRSSWPSSPPSPSCARLLNSHSLLKSSLPCSRTYFYSVFNSKRCHTHSCPNFLPVVLHLFSSPSCLASCARIQEAQPQNLPINHPPEFTKTS
jgi:hypothetical protein